MSIMTAESGWRVAQITSICVSVCTQALSSVSLRVVCVCVGVQTLEAALLEGPALLLVVEKENGATPHR
jgi:hypothetical protein